MVCIDTFLIIDLFFKVPTGRVAIVGDAGMRLYNILLSMLANEQHIVQYLERCNISTVKKIDDLSVIHYLDLAEKAQDKEFYTDYTLSFVLSGCVFSKRSKLDTMDTAALRRRSETVPQNERNPVDQLIICTDGKNIDLLQTVIQKIIKQARGILSYIINHRYTCSLYYCCFVFRK